jgi:hypothetical protein
MHVRPSRLYFGSRDLGTWGLAGYLRCVHRHGVADARHLVSVGWLAKMFHYRLMYSGLFF